MSVHRLEILAYPELNATHLFPVVLEEPFHGWHLSYWMVTVVGYLRRLGTSSVLFIYFDFDQALAGGQSKHCLGDCNIECLSILISCRLIFSHLALQCGKS